MLSDSRRHTSSTKYDGGVIAMTMGHEEVVVTCERIFDKPYCVLTLIRVHSAQQDMKNNRTGECQIWRGYLVVCVAILWQQQCRRVANVSVVCLQGVLGVTRSPVCACPCQCEHRTNGARGNFRKSSSPCSSGLISPPHRTSAVGSNVRIQRTTPGSCTL